MPVYLCLFRAWRCRPQSLSNSRCPTASGGSSALQPSPGAATRGAASGGRKYTWKQSANSHYVVPCTTMSESQLEEVLLFLLPFLCFLLKFSRFSYLPVQSWPLLMSCRPLQMSTSPLAQLPASSHSRMNEMGTIPVGGPGVQQCFACMNSSQSASCSSCEVPVGFPPTLSAYLWF